MPENKHLRRALYCLYGAAAIAIAWLVLRFLLPWLLPFILAFVIARLMEPAVRFLSERYSIRRGFASAMCTLVVFAVLIALTSLIIGRAVIELTALVKDLPTLLGNITRTVGVIGGKIDGFVKSAPAEIQNYLNNAIDGFNAKSAQLPAELSGKVLDFLSHAAKFTPRLILFFFACALGSFFISCGYKEFTGFILRQVPKRRHKSLGDFKNDLLATFGKWIKAELMLAGITFAEMTVAFLILRIEFAILLALLVAVVDLLPVVGSGAVLIPWALVSLIGGNYKTAVTLASSTPSTSSSETCSNKAHRPADRPAADCHAHRHLRRVQRHRRVGHDPFPHRAHHGQAPQRQGVSETVEVRRRAGNEIKIIIGGNKADINRGQGAKGYIE